MSSFIQNGTGIVVSVADEKDDRFASGWKPYDDESAEGSDSIDNLKVHELKQFAADNGIDLGAATKKADILAIIQAAGNGGSDDEDDDESAEGSDSID
nr:MAG TPA_asm: HeH/LEM domain [Caudoviricetes sp.]